MRKVRATQQTAFVPDASAQAAGFLGGSRDSGRAQSFSLGESQPLPAPGLKAEDAQSLLAEVAVVRHSLPRPARAFRSKCRSPRVGAAQLEPNGVARRVSAPAEDADVSERIVALAGADLQAALVL